MMIPRRGWQEMFLAVSWVLIPVTTASAEAAEPDMARAFRASGVAPGLAVHVGACNGDIQASLGDNGRMLVQGLAGDDQGSLGDNNRNLGWSLRGALPQPVIRGRAGGLK